jgi:hypothetical protein
MTARYLALGYEDYAAQPDDGRRYEVHDGELSVTTAPSPRHQIVSRNLFRLLDAQSERGAAARCCTPPST